MDSRPSLGQQTRVRGLSVDIRRSPRHAEARALLQYYYINMIDHMLTTRLHAVETGCGHIQTAHSQRNCNSVTYTWLHVLACLCCEDQACWGPKTLHTRL